MTLKSWVGSWMGLNLSLTLVIDVVSMKIFLITPIALLVDLLMKTKWICVHQGETLSGVFGTNNILVND